MTEKEIENQMLKSLNKIPFEIRKIKFILSVLKKVKSLKNTFRF
ncbi:MAG: hypothetical protein RR523_10925 [Cetobacterium sp.]|nr:hypothetical protein [Cetobacterium sp. 2A]